jgi:hypothetical protein
VLYIGLRMRDLVRSQDAVVVGAAVTIAAAPASTPDKDARAEL